ncbi:MAG: flagellar motor protein MotB, partial [Terracidiphilus sp.]
MKRLGRTFISLAFLASLIAIAGCHHKQKPLPAAETAPPSSAPAPTAQLTATPATISAGDQVVLTWRTTDATNVSIDGIGDVPTSGVKSVTPSATTTYHLVARGEGGSADASATVTVNQPPAVSVPSTASGAGDTFKANVQD